MSELPGQRRQPLEEAVEGILRPMIEYTKAELDSDPTDADDQSQGEPSDPPDEFEADVDE
jgi:hypothetical protein